MKLAQKSFALFSASVLLATLPACRKQSRNRLDEAQFPQMVLWAWERPEDLRALDAQRFAVAFLAQTLTLKGDEVIQSTRHQPLQVTTETKLMAVTRIESSKTTAEHAALSDTQRQKITSLVLKTLQLDRVAAIQIDFDAASSERDFYRSLLQDLRRQIPDKVPLSMTALASFCVGDRWLRDLPVDEAVPMIFRMGADDKTIRNMLSGGDDFREPLCQRSYGVAIDEPPDFQRDAARRVYIFNSHPWNETRIAGLQQSWLK
ncbi:MAG TPA: DUF3142 domain-containing protein [Pyrinomonadaceae bacterium]|nr:DUF3142 domain-containing protein [Pyrinomonadaceae bacterium]